MWGLFALLAAQAVPIAPGLPPMPYSQQQICEGNAHPQGQAALLDLRLGEPFADAMARSTFRFRSDYPPTGIYWTTDRLDLRLRDGARVLDLTGIGGLPNASLGVNENPPGHGISLIRLWYQGRPLTLAEALDRAVTLRRWFIAGGYRALPVVHGVRDSRGFRIASAPNALARPRDRAAAQAMLANRARAIAGMDLFSLRRGRREVQVELENWRRITAILTPGEASEFSACHGREWGVRVYLSAL